MSMRSATPTFAARASVACELTRIPGHFRTISEFRRLALVVAIRRDVIVIAETNDPHWHPLTQIKAPIAVEDNHARTLGL
jgi:hypothetical protein